MQDNMEEFLRNMRERSEASWKKLIEAILQNNEANRKKLIEGINQSSEASRKKLIEHLHDQSNTPDFSSLLKSPSFVVPEFQPFLPTEEQQRAVLEQYCDIIQSLCIPVLEEWDSSVDWEMTVKASEIGELRFAVEIIPRTKKQSQDTEGSASSTD